MRYRKYLQGTTQEQRTQIKKLKSIIKQITDIDIERVSRKQEVVRARKVYFKALSQTTKISYTAMAHSVGQTHATTLHALRNFDYDYKTDKVLKELYDSVYDVFVKGIKIKTPDDFIQENLRMQQKISELTNEMEQLRNELKEARSNNIRPRNQQTKIYNASETIVAF